MTKQWCVILDGTGYPMSSRTAAIKAAEASQTGGRVVGPEEDLWVEPKPQSTVRYQASGNFDDGGLT
jgi:hypothetical protein